MNGFTMTSGKAIGQLDGNWKALTVGDFNGDGHSDILWQHANGIVYEWLMNGADTVGAGAIGLLDLHWKPLV